MHMEKPERPKASEAMTSEIYLRPRMPEKASWMRASARAGLTLARWITQTLNNTLDERHKGEHRTAGKDEGNGSPGRSSAEGEIGRDEPR